MGRRITLILGLSVVLLGTAACGPGATTAPTVAAPTAAAPTTAAPTAAAPTDTATEAPPAGAVTVEAEAVGSAGTILVAGSNGMTLYIFTEDVKDSGESACTGGCITTWPALTVEAGETPTGGPGVTGTFGTITRADDGTLQVTYNGLPLYFFMNDQAPGDLNGVYDKWETVAP
jgi:predicted lipoprotein with Yx(FWY)xxD motif